jgi:hypothetical protein
MARLRLAIAVFSIFYTLTLSAGTRIDDPKTFVSDVYRQLIASQSGHDYAPPDDIILPGWQSYSVTTGARRRERLAVWKSYSGSMVRITSLAI